LGKTFSLTRKKHRGSILGKGENKNPPGQNTKGGTLERIGEIRKDAEYGGRVAEEKGDGLGIIVVQQVTESRVGSQEKGVKTGKLRRGGYWAGGKPAKWHSEEGEVGVSRKHLKRESRKRDDDHG